MDTEYQHELYDSLPQVGEAFQTLAKRGALSLIDTAIRQIFVDHGVESVFGVRLLHRHFDLFKNERMVQYGAVATPWTDNVLQRATETGTVQPSNWLFRGSVAHPYEYSYQDSGSAESSASMLDHTAFLVAYTEFLSLHDLADTLGLVLYEGERQKSINEICLPTERVAINYPAADGLQVRDTPLSDAELDGDFTVPAAWFFDSPVTHACGKTLHLYTHCRHTPPTQIRKA